MEIFTEEQRKQRQETIDRRHEYNLEIIQLIKEYIDIYPELRFIQLLWLLNVVNNMDRFHEESEITLNKIKATIERITTMKENMDNNKIETNTQTNPIQ